MRNLAHLDLLINEYNVESYGISTMKIHSFFEAEVLNGSFML